MEETCYMCHRKKTSREHVPPQCIFPKGRDTKSKEDLRVNLITVPSCDLHNLQKSKDDEYLRFVLASSILGNSHQIDQIEKIQRAWIRRPHVFQSFLKELKPVVINISGKVEESISFKVDLERFESICHHLARGIFYHHYQRKWLGGYKVFSNMLVDLKSENGEDINKSVQKASSYVATIFEGEKEYGENKGIFRYKIISENEKSYAINMIFYDRSEVTVRLKNV